MEFFKQLSEQLQGYSKATLIIMPVAGNLTIAFMPEVKDQDIKDKLKPLQLTGTAEEMDAEFFKVKKEQLEVIDDLPF